MKIENGSRYQETEIVSYVQVINKAEIDRYLQRGKRKVCDCAHGVEGWGEGEFVPPKRSQKSERQKRGKKRGQKSKGRKAGESVNNDTSRRDLDEHAVLRLTWPAEMMCIPAKLSFRQA